MTAPDCYAIEVRDLTAGYDGATVLENISFSVRQGEIFAILGGSGSGKSTLLRHLIGLQQPLSGSILINGRDLSSLSGRERDKELRNIGVLFQSGALFGSMSVTDNIHFPLVEHAHLPAPVREMLIEMKLRMVGIESHAHQAPAELSGGQRKRAGLARAMALDPRILFFDEPSSGLDPLSSAALDRLIIHLNHALGVTIVVVTHDVPSVFAIAHRAIMLDSATKGIVAEGNPHELSRTTPHEQVRRFLTRDGIPWHGGHGTA